VGRSIFVLTRCRTLAAWMALYYAVGYAGHGVAMATYLGTKIAEEMISGSSGKSLCEHSVSQRSARPV